MPGLLALLKKASIAAWRVGNLTLLLPFEKGLIEKGSLVTLLPVSFRGWFFGEFLRMCDKLRIDWCSDFDLASLKD